MIGLTEIREYLGVVTFKQRKRLKELINNHELIVSTVAGRHYTKWDYLKWWKQNKGHLIK